MNNYPLISIAMATYNGARFIEEQLNSLVSQTYPNVEIIIVDDCSTDNTVEILNHFKEAYANIQVFVNDENIGINQTFSRGISICKGDFIAIADQDDIWLSNKLEENLISIGEYSMIYSNSLLIDQSGNSLNKRKFHRGIFYTGTDSRILSIRNNVAGHTVLFKSKLLNWILPIPKYSHYDWWIAFVALNDSGIKFLNDPYVMHRIHDNNLSHGMVHKSEEEGFDAFEKWTDTMLSLPILKNREYYLELKSILDIDSLTLKKIRLIIFNIKYRKLIFYKKRFFSSLNKARKLYLPHIPI